MLVCTSCGVVRHEETLNTYEEIHGMTSMGNFLAEERCDYTCECGGDLVEAKKCPICNEWYAKREGYICDECLDKGETVENALKLGDEEYSKVAINGFVKFYFSEDEINEILIEAAKSMCKPNDKKVAEYCERDIFYFKEWLEEATNEAGCCD